jgi:flagellar basal-body rod protein FlgG
LNREGVLVSQDGYPVLGEGGEITLEAGAVEIDLNGRLIQGGGEVGQLRITDFQDLTQLTKAGNGRFDAPDTAGRQERPEDTSVRQGCLEAANVIAIRAMTEMIETSRAFEAYQKIITTADAATADVIKDVGSVS